MGEVGTAATALLSSVSVRKYQLLIPQHSLVGSQLCMSHIDSMHKSKVMQGISYLQAG